MRPGLTQVRRNAALAAGTGLFDREPAAPSPSPCIRVSSRGPRFPWPAMRSGRGRACLILSTPRLVDGASGVCRGRRPLMPAPTAETDLLDRVHGWCGLTLSRSVER